VVESYSGIRHHLNDLQSSPISPCACMQVKCAHSQIGLASDYTSCVQELTHQLTHQLTPPILLAWITFSIPALKLPGAPSFRTNFALCPNHIFSHTNQGVQLHNFTPFSLLYTILIHTDTDLVTELQIFGNRTKFWPKMKKASILTVQHKASQIIGWLPGHKFP
jgi:hypothetical protein